MPSMDCRACSGEGCDTKLPTLPGPPRPPKSAPLLPMGLGDRPHTGLGGRMPATHTQPNTAHTVKYNERDTETSESATTETVKSETLVTAMRLDTGRQLRVGHWTGES